MNSKKLLTVPKNRGMNQGLEDPTDTHHAIFVSKKRIVGIYGLSLLVAFALFYFYLIVIFDVVGEMLHYKEWLLKNIGTKYTGKLLLISCFFALLSAHVTQAVVWGIFLRRVQLLSSVTEGVYFSAASITTLGYGDILLKYPWRHIGTLIAITGVLMFGCSTAFLFVVLQEVWQHL